MNFIWDETEAANQRCSMKKVFFKILQNWQENTCARASFLRKLSDYVVFIKMKLRQLQKKISDI